MNYLISLLEILAVLALTDAGFLDFSRKSMKFLKFDGACRGHNTVKSRIYNTGPVLTRDSVNIFNMTVIFDEDLRGDELMVTDVKRCRSIDNPDTCETYQTLRSRTYCQFLNSRNLNFMPRITCPIKKGRYSSSHYELDLGAYLVFADGKYWRMTMNLYQKPDDILVSCLNIDAEVTTKS